MNLVFVREKSSELQARERERARVLSFDSVGVGRFLVLLSELVCAYIPRMLTKWCIHFVLLIP